MPSPHPVDPYFLHFQYQRALEDEADARYRYDLAPTPDNAAAAAHAVLVQDAILAAQAEFDRVLRAGLANQRSDTPPFP